MTRLCAWTPCSRPLPETDHRKRKFHPNCRAKALQARFRVRYRTDRKFRVRCRTKARERYRFVMSAVGQPWRMTWRHIKDRCENPKQLSYANYGAKGIRCLLTVDEVKLLWHRDRAWELTRPSIDRIDPDKDYTLANCRYIEQAENRSCARPGGGLAHERLCMTCHHKRMLHRKSGACLVVGCECFRFELS